MIITLPNNKRVDLSKGIDISIPLRDSTENPRAWYVDPPKFTPVRTDNWVGVVKEGGAVNFRDIYFNPHGHGTHTECLGHITPEIYSVNEALDTYFFNARLATVELTEVVQSGQVDWVILPENLRRATGYESCEALIIRTTPNNADKLVKNYSATNPPYIHESCLTILTDLGVNHLLIDLPSVDKELDGGLLVFHHGFWGVPDQPKRNKTITEFIYVPDEVKDGDYLLNLQVAPFENDASPSRPVLYKPF